MTTAQRKGWVDKWNYTVLRIMHENRWEEESSKWYEVKGSIPLHLNRF